MAASDVKTTRLRYIAGNSLEAVYMAVDKLGFKVEVKGGPVVKDDRWFLSFVLPELEGLDMQNIELED